MPANLGAAARLRHKRGMHKPYEITPRLTKIDGALGEVPADTTPEMRTWSSFCFFVPGWDPNELMKKLGREALTVRTLILPRAEAGTGRAVRDY